MGYQTRQARAGLGGWQLAEALACTQDDIRDRYLEAKAHAEEAVDRARAMRALAEEHLRRARATRAEAWATCKGGNHRIRQIAASPGDRRPHTAL
jgi:hypothetical protein